MSFFSELKRRNVFRVGAAYAVVAWLLLQLADILLGNFGAPDWVFKSLVVVIVIGFPLALFLSWAYELTPEGVKRSEDVTLQDSAVSQTGRRINLLIVAGLLAVVAILVVERVWFAGSVAPLERAEAALGPQSIAVLPFANFSASEQDGYFADGLADTLLHRLAQLRQLTVIARNSSFAYRGQNIDLRRVGEELGVAAVLEGSVQRQGERIRVIAQLIETAGGSHLWSETFDRPMADIFAIQDEIALAVVSALEVELLGAEAEALAQPATTDALALAYLMQAGELQEQMRLSGSMESGPYLQARDLYRKAIERDPTFIDAWLGLARAHDRLAFLSRDSAERAAATAAGQAAVRHALALDPASPEALAQLAWSHFRQEQMVEALAIWLGLLERTPNDTELMTGAGLALLNLGRSEEALVLFERVFKLDPLGSMGNFRHRGMSNIAKGRLDSARAIYVEGVRRFPDFDFFYSDMYGLEGHVAGRWPQALDWTLRGYHALPQNASAAAQVTRTAALFGYDELAAAWQARHDRRTSSPTARGWLQVDLLLAQGRPQEALAALASTLPAATSEVTADQRVRWAALCLAADDAVCALETARSGLAELGIRLDDRFYLNDGRERLAAAVYGLAEQRHGDRAVGEHLLRQALETARQAPAQGAFAWWLLARHYAEAELLAVLGEREAALAALEAALPADGESVLLQSRLGVSLPIQHSPYLVSLHDEPRFQAVMAEIQRRRDAMAGAIRALLEANERGAER